VCLVNRAWTDDWVAHRQNAWPARTFVGVHYSCTQSVMLAPGTIIWANFLIEPTDNVMALNVQLDDARTAAFIVHELALRT
jgi:hypothetical protein